MLEDLKNNIDFFIRNITKFSRRNFIEKNTELIKINYAQNLYMKDILNQCFEKIYQDSLKVLDIGCKNWFYAKGQHAYFSEFCRNVFMDGVEIDAFRLYSNFYSRYEVAKYYIKDLKNAKYIAGDLLKINDRYDYIIWILPFITKTPLKAWGLPVKYFCPEKMLLHAVSLLSENGQMLIVNQGIDEAKVQEELFKQCNINYNSLGEIKSEYYQFKNPRFGFLIKKKY